MAQAISNYKARLMYKEAEGSEYLMLLPIKGTPAIGGEPNRLEITSNEDSMQTFIPGIEQVGDGTSVKANYSSEDYDKVAALKNKELDLAIWFGNEGDGAAGKYGCKGQVTVSIDSSEVDAPVEMSISIMNSTPWAKVVA